MRETIIVVSTDEEQLAALGTMLEGQDYEVVRSRSAQGLASLPREHGSAVIILDLDTVAADNRLLREVKQETPSVHIVLISAAVFHPELREAMVSYVDVCLSKPTNPDELQFWLRSIFQDKRQPRAGPDLTDQAAAGRVHRGSHRQSQGDEEMPQ
jgi:DNA-binding NtrC family response regulator